MPCSVQVTHLVLVSVLLADNVRLHVTYCIVKNYSHNNDHHPSCKSPQLAEGQNSEMAHRQLSSKPSPRRFHFLHKAYQYVYNSFIISRYPTPGSSSGADSLSPSLIVASPCSSAILDCRCIAEGPELPQFVACSCPASLGFF
jgi:hypothetical protein